MQKPRSSDKPLFLITRPAPDNQQTSERLRELGFFSHLLPLLKRKNLNFDLPDMSNFCALVITSTNTLRALQHAQIIPGFTSMPVFIVGEKTSDFAASLGYDNIVSTTATVHQLGEAIKNSRPKGSIIYPSATHHHSDLATFLADEKISVLQVSVYQMIARQSLTQREIASISALLPLASLIYSRRSAEIFAKVIAAHFPNARTQFTPICLSTNVAKPLLAAGYKNVYVATEPNQQAIMQLAMKYARTHLSGCGHEQPGLKE